jgi:predicted Fe-Mo cluster-binding NifX family protein
MASTATKVVLIGCGVIVIAGIIVIAAGGFFVRSKIQEFTKGGGDYAEKTEQLSKEYPFQPPASGIITDQQIRRFIEVRKQVHTVYQRYESEFKKLENKDQNLSVLTKGWSFLKDIRKQHAEALATQKMSPEEYQYIVNAVYKTWMAAGTRDVLKDRSFSDVAKKELKDSISKIDHQLADPDTPEAARKALQKTRAEFQSQLQNLDQNSVVKKMDSTLDSIPPENLKLFQKYEKELKEYSMGGLDLVGM